MIVDRTPEEMPNTESLKSHGQTDCWKTFAI
jgi:hypothetical protein